MAPGPRIEPRPHWCEASALATASFLPLLPCINSFGLQEVRESGSHCSNKGQVNVELAIVIN